jgi:hypothetical protein
MRSENGFNALTEKVAAFCEQYEIQVTVMSDSCVHPGRPRRGETASQITNEHHFRVSLFYSILDTQLTELNERFPEASSLLLKRIAFLSPHLLAHSEVTVTELVALAEMYPSDFSEYEQTLLPQQIKNFAMDLRTHPDLRTVDSLSALAVKMTELKKSTSYPLVYRLIALALTLPVSTATTERSFSALRFVKKHVRNRMGEELLSNALLLFIENDLNRELVVDEIIDRFKNMAVRRSQF